MIHRHAAYFFWGWVGMLALQGAGSPAYSAPPAEPQNGIDFQAFRAFVGDPVLGIEPGEQGSIFSYLPDTALPMASVTKSFTLLLAAEAVADGSVQLDDLITVSNYAATINNNHSGGHSSAGLSAGQSILFEDLLYGMMIPSGGDASIAVAEHVAGAASPIVASWPSWLKHLAFVSMMNQRAVELGLDDTTFFNAYGGDHAHAADNTPGASVPHRATARDIARWFDVGLDDPLFREVAGFRGTYPGFGWASGFIYPGLVAQKPGGNGSCTSCRGAAAKRVGRELIGSFEAGANGDMIPLLDYGYASLFHPNLEAQSAPYTKGWVQNDLACVSENRAASAVVRPDGTLRMLLWDVDLAGQTIQHANPITAPGWATPVGGIVFTQGGGDPSALPYASRTPTAPPRPRPGSIAIRPTSPPPPAGPGALAVDLDGGGHDGFDPAPDLDSGQSAPIVSEARIAYASEGHLVVATTTSQGVYLHAYAIFANDTIGLRDTQFVGSGDLGRVAALASDLVVTAHRNGSGLLQVTSFRLDTGTGLLSNAIDTSTRGSTGGEIELAIGRKRLLRQNFVTAELRVNGQRQMRGWSVSRFNGAISHSDVTTFGGAVRSIAVASVPGFGTRDIYALAYRNGGGRLVVESWEFMAGGTLSGSALQTQTDRFLAAGETIRMAAYAEGGVMLAIQPLGGTAEQLLETWSLDPRSWSPSSTVNVTTLFPNRIAQETVAQNGIHGICRVSGTAAEGDFLVATGALAEEGITVGGWRSAPRY